MQTLMDAETPDVTPYVAAAMARIEDDLLAGLEPDQASWTERAYRETVLPYHLRFAPTRRDEAERRDDVQQVADQLCAALRGLPREERWASILNAYYVAALRPLSDRAFELAEQTHTSGSVQAALAQEAAALQGRIERLAQEVARSAPDTAETLAEELSEATVDCLYAQQRGPMLSLRLGRATAS